MKPDLIFTGKWYNIESNSIVTDAFLLKKRNDSTQFPYLFLVPPEKYSIFRGSIWFNMVNTMLRQQFGIYCCHHFEVNREVPAPYEL